jgi:5'-3' exonuclease
MGIPAYYRTLCDSVPHLLLNKLSRDITIGSLWIDFNCIIYHCIRRPGTQPYPGEEGRIQWENDLIRIVRDYVKQLIRESGLEEGGFVFLGIDGVVPMAKMRQQRKRRFKSAWLAEHEMKLGKPFEEKWDTNSLTPGTAFMERLGSELGGNGWLVSTADEPGEGEQKVFNLLRKVGAKGKGCVIYGLDADLILMSLYQQLHQKEDIFLFRECTEFGCKPGGTEEYRFLNTQTLLKTIGKKYNNQEEQKKFIIDYCAVMMLLGNDFIPHGIWFTIKDGGHTRLEDILERVRGQKGQIITDDMHWNKNCLVEILKHLAAEEDKSMGSWIYKKFQRTVRRSRDAIEPWQQNVDDWNQLPISEQDEKRLLSVHKDNYVKLAPSWRTTYNEAYLSAYNDKDVKMRAEVYCSGLEWALSYLTGFREVSWTWMYPWSYSPLWQDIINNIDSLKLPVYENLNILPQEQLALVLPLSSWWLIRDLNLKKLPYLLPHMWKFDLEFCTAGKRMMWECDPHIPLLTPQRLRFLQLRAKESQIRWDNHNPKDLTQRMSESIQTY